MHIMLQTATNN